MAVPGSINRTASRRAVLGIAAAGALAAACSRAPRPAGEQAARGRESVTLRLTWVAKEFEHTFQVMGPVFEQRYPWVKLQLEASPDYLEKLTVLFATNTIGDVMFLESDDEAFFAYWAAAGMLRQLDDYIKRDKYDLNVFFPEAIRALRSVDGNMWAFPYKAFMARCGLFFNIDLLEQTGMRLPTDDWTYDDLAQAAQKLTRRSGGEVEIWGGGRKMGGDLAFTAIMRAFGGDLYTPDGKRTLVGQPRSQEAINWWLDRYLNDGTIVPDLAANSFTLFQQGKVALLAGHNPGDRVTIANALNPNNVRWGLVLMPKGPAGRRGGSFFITPTGIAKISKHPEEAWEFQKFLAEKETGVVMGFPTPQSGQTSSHFGARKDVYTDPRLLNAPGMPPGVMQALARSMELPEPLHWPHNFRAAEVEKVLNDEVRKAVRGEVKANAGFFQNLERLIQNVLDQPRPTPQ
jgi:multiple sugar transport system substrate-binding protein